MKARQDVQTGLGKFQLLTWLTRSRSTTAAPGSSSGRRVRVIIGMQMTVLGIVDANVGTSATSCRSCDTAHVTTATRKSLVLMNRGGTRHGTRLRDCATSTCFMGKSCPSNHVLLIVQLAVRAAIVAWSSPAERIVARCSSMTSVRQWTGERRVMYPAGSRWAIRTNRNGVGRILRRAANGCHW